MKRRIYEILEVAPPGDRTSNTIDLFIMTLILANVLAVILESVASFSSRYRPLFDGFELFSVLVFTVEYLLRLGSCTADSRFAPSLRGRLRFAITPLALIDLVAILPFYVPFVVTDVRILRAMRLLRILRVLKLGRYSEAFRLLGTLIHNKRNELTATFTVLVALLVVTSALMYEVEHTAQPEHFHSIPASMWWAIVTLTTVGYGDIVPITLPGKIIGAVMTVVGIMMVALPTGIIGGGFVELFQARKAGSMTCPHCGNQIEPTIETVP